MWKFYEGVKDIPNVTVYGDFSTKNRCAIVALNIGDYDSAEVSDEPLYGIWYFYKTGWSLCSTGTRSTWKCRTRSSEV